jgi:hypothetical protein
MHVRNMYTILVGNLKGKDHLRAQGADRRIILK